MVIVYAYLPRPYSQREIYEMAACEFFSSPEQREHTWQLVARLNDDDTESIDRLSKKYKSLKIRNIPLDKKFVMTVKDDFKQGYGDIKGQKMWWVSGTDYNSFYK